MSPLSHMTLDYVSATVYIISEVTFTVYFASFNLLSFLFMMDGVLDCLIINYCMYEGRDLFED